MALIPKVDEHNIIVGETDIDEAKRNNWPRRIVRVFLFDETGRLLLQLRAPQVISFPNRWDQSVGGHVDVAETEEQAAQRELTEELGISDVELTLVAEGVKSDRPDDYVFSYIYRGVVPSTSAFNPDPGEVSGLQWYTIADFEVAVRERPEAFVPTFVALYQMYRDKLIYTHRSSAETAVTN